MYLYKFLYCVFVIVYISDQIALNYVVCIYFASPGASHLLNLEITDRREIGLNSFSDLGEETLGIGVT